MRYLILTEGPDGADVRTEVQVRPIHLMETERAGKGGDDHGVERAYFSMWCALGKPGADFDAWAATLIDAEQIADPAVGPTKPAPSADESPS